MTERIHLPERWRRMAQEVLQAHVPDAEVWAYGSRVNGTDYEASDMDLVIRGPDLGKIPVLRITSPGAPMRGGGRWMLKLRDPRVMEPKARFWRGSRRKRCPSPPVERLFRGRTTQDT